MSIQLMHVGDDLTVSAHAETGKQGSDESALAKIETLPTPERYDARLTIDVTQNLRTRIRIAAIRQGKTAKELVRSILEREFPRDRNDANGESS